MSVSSTSSSSSFELPITGQTTGQHGSSANNEKQDEPKDTNVEKSRTSNTVDKNVKKKASVKKMAPPVMLTPVRTKLGQRERSVSSPVLVRPLPYDRDPITKASQTPDAKATSRQSKEIDTDRLPKQPKQDDDRLPSSPPKLRSKLSQPLLKPLTTEQQLANDLADLMGKTFLRKKEKVDDEIPVSQMTASLQRFAGKPADAKVRITDLMLKMFSDVMKKSKAWDIASRIMVTIRREYFQGRDQKSVLDTRLEKEATDMLALLAASFAGAFFNVSGNDEKNRLPEPIRQFLHAADHQQVRVLLSTPAGTAMSKEEFLRGRRDWLAKVLIQTFLKPLVLKEFSLESGTLESSNTADHIIHALHVAFKTSAPGILVDSLRSPPDDIAELMLKRRANQFRPRNDRQDDEKKSDKGDDDKKEKKQLPGDRHLLSNATSPSRQRRMELNRFLKKTMKELAPADLTEDMLKGVRTFNNEFAVSGERIESETLLKAWLAIAKKTDASSAAATGLQKLLDEQIELSTIEKDMVEADVLAKLSLIESRGLPFDIERARRLSSDLPLPASPDSTASPISLGSSSSTTPPSTSEVTSRRRATRSPASPTRHTQHKRSKTADVTMPDERTLPSGLTIKEREALIMAFPHLLFKAVRRAAMVKTAEGIKLKIDPVMAMTQIGRADVSISMRDLPQSLLEKIQAKFKLKNDAQTISHAKLWTLLMMDAMVTSRAGRLLLTTRFKAVNAAGTFTPLAKPISVSDQQTGNDALAEKMRTHADAVLSEIFGNGLLQAGLPEEVIATWRKFDRELQEWVENDPSMKLKLQEFPKQHPTVTTSGMDWLRSAFGFDLMVTRLIYSVAYGKKEADPPVAARRFADAVQKSLKPLWDKQLFDELKAMQSLVTTNDSASTSIRSSTSQDPSAQQ